MPDKQSRKYLALILVPMLGLLAAIAALNYAVDPYGIYSDWKPGAAYPASDTYIRIHKTERIKRLKPDALILGTSRADAGMNPKPEFFKGLTPYNAALSAANVYEQRLMLEFAHRVRPIKTLVLTLDMFTFNTKRLENRHFEKQRVAADALTPLHSFINTYGTLVTLDTLLVVNKHFRQMKHLDREAYPRANGHKVRNNAEWRSKHQGVHSVFWASPNALALGAKEFSYDYSDKKGDDTFAQFRMILDFCEREKIDTYLFFGPLHHTHFEKLREEGHWALFEDWKKRVADIVRRTPYPLWDFAYYNSVTGEKLPARDDVKTQMKYFWDMDHYKENVGDVIQRKIFGKAERGEFPDFGRKLL